MIFLLNLKKLNIKHNICKCCKKHQEKSRSSKAYKSQELLGASWVVCKEWIEKQFKPGMSWNNYGLHGWHIDHIRPCASFDLTDPIQQKQCFHYTNLQPLWASENLSKGAKY
jgi:hypothetical protein